MRKTVTISLKEISVVVDGENDKELLANAKKAVVEQINTKFPSCTYSISGVGALSFETAYPGTIVSDNNGDLGIVTGVNQKTINVTLTGGRGVYGAPNLFSVSEATFEEARSKRRNFNIENVTTGESSSLNCGWYEGDTGYLKVKDNERQVVVGKKAGKKYKLYLINEKGASYTVTEEQLKACLKDEPSK